MNKLLKLIVVVGLLSFLFWKWVSDTQQAMISDYISYGHRYGSTATAQAVRRVMTPWSSQLHALRMNGEFQRCALYVRGQGSGSPVVDSKAEEAFKQALLDLAKPENRQSDARFDRDAAKRKSAELWGRAMLRNGLPNNPYLIAELYKSSEPESGRLLCLLTDDLWQHLMALGEAPEVIAFGRLWLSSMGR